MSTVARNLKRKVEEISVRSRIAIRRKVGDVLRFAIRVSRRVVKARHVTPQAEISMDTQTPLEGHVESLENELVNNQIVYNYNTSSNLHSAYMSVK